MSTTRTIILVCAAALIGSSALFAWSLVRTARVIPESRSLASVEMAVPTATDRLPVYRP